MIQRFRTNQLQNTDDNSTKTAKQRSFVVIGAKKYIPTQDSEYSDVEILTEDLEDEDGEDDIGSSNGGAFPGMKEADIKNISKQLFVPRYADKIYENDSILEKSLLIDDGSFEKVQTEITPKMRAIVVKWLITLADEFSFTSETLYNAIAYMDHYLSKKSIEKNMFQLLGAVCLWTSAKCHELTIPAISDLTELCNREYTHKEFCMYERNILYTNNFRSYFPTTKSFLRRLQIAIEADKPTIEVSSFICETTLLNHKIPCFRPSVVACAIMIISTIGLDKMCPIVSLQEYSHLDNLEETIEIIPLIMSGAQEVVSKKQGIIYQKYTGLNPKPSILQIDFTNPVALLARVMK